MGKNWFMFVAMSLGTEFAVMSAIPVPDEREAGHPCVVTTPSEKSATLKLIEEQDWARKVVEVAAVCAGVSTGAAVVTAGWL